MRSGVSLTNILGTAVIDTPALVGAKRRARAYFLLVLLERHSSARSNLMRLARKIVRPTEGAERVICNWAYALKLIRSAKALGLEELWVFHFAKHASRSVLKDANVSNHELVGSWAVDESRQEMAGRQRVWDQLRTPRHIEARRSNVSTAAVERTYYSRPQAADPGHESLQEFLGQCKKHFRARRELLFENAYVIAPQLKNPDRDAEWLFQAHVLGRSCEAIAAGFPAAASISERAVAKAVSKYRRLVFSPESEPEN